MQQVHAVKVAANNLDCPEVEVCSITQCWSAQSN